MATDVRTPHQPEPPIPTRQSLVGRLKNWEDQTSWQSFYDTYSRFIYGVALKSGLTREEASDALQETVLAVAKAIKDFTYDRSKGSFKAWLYQQTRWRIGDQFRRREPRARDNSDESHDTLAVERLADPSGAEPEEAFWDEEWHQNLLTVAEENVKKRVRPATFQMYLLYARKQWPIAEVAHSLGVSRAQVYVAKCRIENLLCKEGRRLAKRAALSPAKALGS